MKSSKAATFAVVYTPDALTADDVIEQWIGKSPEPKACVVATGDNAESRTARSLGATVCPPEDLKVWCDQASARPQQLGRHQVAAAAGGEQFDDLRIARGDDKNRNRS